MTDLGMLAILKDAIGRAGLDQVELYCRHSRRGISRFSRTELNQNAAIDEAVIHARVAMAGGRIGASTTSVSTPDGILGAIRDAAQAARCAPPLADFPGFAPASPDEPVPRWARSTAEASPSDRAEILRAALARVREEGLDAAGTLETTQNDVAVVTTAGARKFARATAAGARLFVSGPDSSGFAGAFHRDLAALDVGELTDRAIERCRRGASPVALEPGAYDVVLEPEAVTELLEWLAYSSLGAREVEDGSSALAGRISTRITGDWVTLADDATDSSELGMGLPFDAEGTNRARVPLIEGGVAAGVVYDRVHAARAGRPSTGHALPGAVDDGPLPSNLFLAAGDRTMDDLVGMVERGIYVSRFHYVNGLVDTRRAVMTGMTRDGTFLIENGRLGRGVANLRFTDSLLEALERVEGATRERRAVPSWYSDGGAHVAPAILVRAFRFTGERAP
ncbi:MAG: TldD/PmbA family protein [Deltaproteobacteria bacterium]|nr:TldD/PmbA family protein [Deltaproteobacteria bacterium]